MYKVKTVYHEREKVLVSKLERRYGRYAGMTVHWSDLAHSLKFSSFLWYGLLNLKKSPWLSLWVSLNSMVISVGLTVQEKKLGK